MPKKKNQALNEHCSAKPTMIYPTRDDQHLAAPWVKPDQAKVEEEMLRAAARWLLTQGWYAAAGSADRLISLSIFRPGYSLHTPGCANAIELVLRFTGWPRTDQESGPAGSTSTTRSRSKTKQAGGVK